MNPDPTQSDVIVSAMKQSIVDVGRSLFDRKLAPGSSGNISVLLDDGSMLITPTRSSLGRLDARSISEIGADGEHCGGPPPSKELVLHRALYDARPKARAIVHLHATYSAAVSCIAGLPADDCLPPLTPYFVMKIGKLPIVDYARPGDPTLAGEISRIGASHPAILLANHGPLVAGTDLHDASDRAEELEETAKLFLLLRGSSTRTLTDEQIGELAAHFPLGG